MMLRTWILVLLSTLVSQTGPVFAVGQESENQITNLSDLASAADPTADIAAVLDRFHAAATEADLVAYFGCLHPDAVFLGTDAGERWTKAEFEVFVRPYFDAGRGWTYVPVQRHIHLDHAGSVSWFDEILHNDKYGTCRGTGVVRRDDAGHWTIAQYNLTFTVPNDVAGNVVSLIATHESDSDASLRPTTVFVVRHAEKMSPTARDPDLSPAGHDRARRLGEMLAAVPITGAYASQFKRTQQTLAPLAEARDGVDVKVIDARDPNGLAETIRVDHRGGNVAVAGHSNTVPAVLRALGVEDAPNIADSEYDNLFIVTLTADGGVHLTTLKF